MKWVGIDPGLSGVVAWYDDESQRFDWFNIPVEDRPGIKRNKDGGYKSGQSFIKREIDASMLAHELESGLKADGFTISFCVERVATMSGQGMASAGSLMHTAGVIKGVIGGLYGALNAYESVRPATWMKELGLHGKKKVKGYNPMKEFVVEKLKITQRINKDVADALCIAWYCYLMHKEGEVNTDLPF